MKVGDKVNVYATSHEFAHSTLAHVLDTEQPIECEVKGINDDKTVNVTGFDHVGQFVNLKSVKPKKTKAEGWYIK